MNNTWNKIARHYSIAAGFAGVAFTFGFAWVVSHPGSRLYAVLGPVVAAIFFLISGVFADHAKSEDGEQTAPVEPMNFNARLFQVGVTVMCAAGAVLGLAKMLGEW
ncbi:hypothetical protein KSF73_06590 [Burkholderiaceae bacterium DAT-1]|nr:hypothetical protein [Burkholderiaceae bacterium DAT-1]